MDTGIFGSGLCWYRSVFVGFVRIRRFCLVETEPKTLKKDLQGTKNAEKTHLNVSKVLQEVLKVNLVIMKLQIGNTL